MADKNELQTNNTHPMSNVVSFVRKQFMPSWDNLSGLTKVAAGVILGIVATPYLFNQQSDIVTTISSNVSELKPLSNNKMTELAENIKLDSVVTKQNSRSLPYTIINNICIDRNGFGLSTQYEGKVINKENCDLLQSRPTIIDGVPFRVSVVPPITGKMTITKFLGAKAKTIVADIHVAFGKAYTAPQDVFTKVANQDGLIYEISFSQSEIKYSRIIKFDTKVNNTKNILDATTPSGESINCKKVGTKIFCD